MNCPQCQQPVETGARFCGNCGQALGMEPAAAAVATSPLPSYAAPSPPTPPVGETKAILSFIFGLLGIVGALFVVIFGLASGVVGVVLATLSRHSTKRGFSTAGLAVSVLAIIASLAAWALLITHHNNLNHKLSTAPSANTAAQTVANLSTPCFSIDFGKSLVVQNTSGSCDMDAYNGSSLDTSTNVYKVYASAVPQLNANNFMTLAKQAIEKDVGENLPGFSISSESPATFAGSPAYLVETTNGSGVAVMEGAVLHPSSTENFFVIVHAQNADSVDLSTLQTGWQWN